MTPLPNPFITDDEHRFVLNEDLFLEQIDAAPKFIRDPSQEFLHATTAAPILEELLRFSRHTMKIES